MLRLATVLLVVALPCSIASAQHRPPPDAPRAQLLDLEVSGRRFRSFAFDGHVHTNHSRDAHQPTHQVLALAEHAGLDALVITDHGSSHAQRDLAAYSGRVSVLVGEEVGGAYGHALIWNVINRTGVDLARGRLNDLGAHAQGAGGVLVLAHPGWWMDGNIFDPRRWMDPRALRRGGMSQRVDALELWNQVYHRRTRELIDEWVGLLEQGLYVPIVGNSDFHTRSAHVLGTPRNVFLCEVDRAGRPIRPIGQCLLEAVRAGRLYVTDGPSLALSLEQKTLGEVVSAAPGAFLSGEVRVRAPEGGTLRLYVGRILAQSFPLAPGQDRTERFTVRAPSRDSHVRIEMERLVRDTTRPSLCLVSNPVLLDVPPAQTSWRGPDEGRIPPPVGYRRPRSQRAIVARAPIQQVDRLESEPAP